MAGHGNNALVFVKVPPRTTRLRPRFMRGRSRGAIGPVRDAPVSRLSGHAEREQRPSTASRPCGIGGRLDGFRDRPCCLRLTASSVDRSIVLDRAPFPRADGLMPARIVMAERDGVMDTLGTHICQEDDGLLGD